MHLCHVKDVEGRGERHPIPMQARALEAKRRKAKTPDPLCFYSLLREAWLEDVAALGEAAAKAAPIFRRSVRGGYADAFDTPRRGEHR